MVNSVECTATISYVNIVALIFLHFMCLQVIAERLSEEEIAGLRQMFKAVDVKNRGVITLGELREGLRRYGTELEDSEISDIVEVVSSCLLFFLMSVTKTCSVHV